MSENACGTVESLKNLFENHSLSRKNISHIEDGINHNFKSFDSSEEKKLCKQNPKIKLETSYSYSSGIQEKDVLGNGLTSNYCGSSKESLQINENSSSSSRSINNPSPRPKPKPWIFKRFNENLEEVSQLQSFPAQNRVISPNLKSTVDYSHVIPLKSKNKIPSYAVNNRQTKTEKLTSTEKPAIAKVQTKNLILSNTPRLQETDNIPFANTILTPFPSKGSNIQNLPVKIQGSSKNPKTPPPVPKKPRSIKNTSGISANGQINIDSDRELKNTFRVKTNTSEYVEKWATFQADSQQEFAIAKLRHKNNNAVKGIKQKNEASSMSDNSTSSTDFTNSSIRSILKKRNSRGPHKSKNISFKDQLVTKYDYPSEDSIDSDNSSSLEMYRPSLTDSDQDSDSGATPTRRHNSMLAVTQFALPSGADFEEHFSDSEVNTICSSSTLQDGLPYTYDSKRSHVLILGSSAKNFGNPFKRFVPAASGIQFHY